MRKVERARVEDLSNEIQLMDSQNSAYPHSDHYRKRLLLQAAADLLTKSREELLKSRQSFFEMADKAGRLLAHQACGTTTSRAVPRINTPLGETIYDPVHITNTFHIYSNKLQA